MQNFEAGGNYSYHCALKGQEKCYLCIVDHLALYRHTYVFIARKNVSAHLCTHLNRNYELCRLR
jgi:hypothetical protein